MNMKNKRGLSPVIATMLLVGIVIVIAIIVFLWARGITEEAVTKFDGTNIKIVCDEVSFDASLSNNNLYLSNTGNVPIYKMKVKIYGEGGEFSTEFVQNGWPSSGLNQGGTTVAVISQSSTKILLTPILIGHSESGDVEYSCEERHGREILNV